MWCIVIQVDKNAGHAPRSAYIPKSLNLAQQRRPQICTADDLDVFYEAYDQFCKGGDCVHQRIQSPPQAAPLLQTVQALNDPELSLAAVSALCIL